MTEGDRAPALLAEGLAKTFGGVRALKGVDLRIEHGDPWRRREQVIAYGTALDSSE